MNALVVDDEPLARDWLIRLLARLNVQVCGEASDGQQALAQARIFAPDVVLLDIQIPGLSGLQVARALGDVPFVFTTAHARYAVDAFEVEACDYLLKPVGYAQLATSLDRARRRRLLHELMRKDDAALDSVSPFSATHESASPGVAAPEAGTLIVRERGITRIVDARRVTRFRALDKYTSFQLDGEEFFVRDALDSLEARLSPFGFLRVHRAELVRRTAILGLTSEASGGVSLQLTDGQLVAVSRRYQAATRRALGIVAGCGNDRVAFGDTRRQDAIAGRHALADQRLRDGQGLMAVLEVADDDEQGSRVDTVAQRSGGALAREGRDGIDDGVAQIAGDGVADVALGVEQSIRDGRMRRRIARR